MGFFSWKTVDTNDSISNKHSDIGALPVALLIPKEFGGGAYIEKDYNGYGIFGNRDAYALIVEWNFPEKFKGDDGAVRGFGIDMSSSFGSPSGLKYSLKFVTLDTYEKDDVKFEDFPNKSLNCPYQGYFYPEELSDDCDGEEEDYCGLGSGAWDPDGGEDYDDLDIFCG